MPAYPMRTLKESEWPPLLREIPDKPSRLYIRGAMPPKGHLYLCVVGSRACTPYARRMTQKIIAGLAQYPVAIVSGMALGIDSEAHKAALDVGLHTVAVLPSSVHEEALYPSTNRPLAQRILAQGGALISETGVPYRAMLHDFAKRNRISAGMCTASLIVEAGEKSGTLITARLAMDYNREVLAIPHELGKDTGMGVNKLIRDGATLVRDAADILQALGLRELEPVQQALPTDLSAEEAQVLHALTEPLVRDELIERAELSAQAAGIALSSLQIRGLIVERLGKIERV